MKQIFAREAPMTFEGDQYQLPFNGEGATGLGKPLKSILHCEENIPIYAASITPRGVEAAAEVADGFFPIWMDPEKYSVFSEPINTRSLILAEDNNQDGDTADPSDTPAVQQPRQARTGQPLFGCLGVVCSRPPGNGTDLFARLACGVAASSAGLPEPGPGLASPGAAAAASAPGRMQLNFGHPRVVATLSHAQHDKHKSHARVAVALTWLSL